MALTHYTHNVDAIGTFIQPGEGPIRGLLHGCENQLLPMDRLQHYESYRMDKKATRMFTGSGAGGTVCDECIGKLFYHQSMYLINNVYKHPQLCVMMRPHKSVYD